MNPSVLLEPVIALVRAAGAAILEVYSGDFSIERKGDDSPLTAADRAAHELLARELVQLDASYPVLSEEGADIDWKVRQTWPRYWLVDPLDGTREFVKRNGEFTVNVALIEDGSPILGVVLAPALEHLCYAARGFGAWRRAANTQDIRLACRQPAAQPLRVAASRSHLDERTLAVLQRIGPHERFGMGSSLKFLHMAEGRVDFYPRFGPTSEWDTAAAQCVLEEAGGAVLGIDGSPLRYNQKSGLLNPDFLALGDPHLPWRSWIDG